MGFVKSVSDWGFLGVNHRLFGSVPTLRDTIHNPPLSNGANAPPALWAVASLLFLCHMKMDLFSGVRPSLCENEGLFSLLWSRRGESPTRRQIQSPKDCRERSREHLNKFTLTYPPFPSPTFICKHDQFPNVHIKEALSLSLSLPPSLSLNARYIILSPLYTQYFL